MKFRVTDFPNQFFGVLSKMLQFDFSLVVQSEVQHARFKWEQLARMGCVPLVQLDQRFAPAAGGLQLCCPATAVFHPGGQIQNQTHLGKWTAPCAPRAIRQGPGQEAAWLEKLPSLSH